MKCFSLERFPLHLGPGGAAIPQPEMSGMEWYSAYAERHAADGGNGWLVSLHSFSKSWTNWEKHPAGDEVVICMAGEITIVQELPNGETQSVVLGAGEYAINPPGVWHTADITGHATALFITVGWGTEHRPR